MARMAEMVKINYNFIHVFYTFYQKSNKMKQILTIVMLLVVNFTFAQDMLTLKSGKDLKTKITEIDKDAGKVKYKSFDNLDGPTYTEKINEVLMIRYQNGTIETFGDVKAPNETVVANPNVPIPNPNNTTTTVTKPTQEVIVVMPTTTRNDVQNVCSQAEQDARFSYTGQNSGKGWTAAITILLTPLIGLIPAAACSAQAPDDSNLNMRNNDMRNSSEYYNCYKEEAHNIKKKKVWAAYGVGCAIWLIFYAASSAG
jgi:hypothetical protein